MYHLSFWIRWRNILLLIKGVMVTTMGGPLNGVDQAAMLTNGAIIIIKQYYE